MTQRAVAPLPLEVLHRPADGGRPPKPRQVLFVHGSYCGAWVWEENLTPYFAQHGYDSIAFSFRGHGRSPGRSQINTLALSDYVDDLESVYRQFETPPILVAHSLGAKVVERFVQKYEVPAVVLLAPVSPFGLASSAMNVVKKAPMLWWQMSLMGALGLNTVDNRLLGQELFSSELPDHKRELYLSRFQPESGRVAMELAMQTHPWRDGHAFPPSLMLGGDNDLLVPLSDLKNTAKTYGSDLTVLPGANHVLMLDTCWQEVADRMLRWLAARGL